MREIDYSAYQNGVTVIRDEMGPTGYLAVFVFDEAGITPEYIAYYKKQYGVALDEKLDLANIARVQVYSNTALLFNYKEQKKHVILYPQETAHDPAEFCEGFYPAGGDTHPSYKLGKVNYDCEMTKLADGRWGCAFPLTCGASDYNIRLFDAAGNSDGTYLFDPANPPMLNTASGVYSRSSMVYVPYDPEKQPNYCDREIENPKTEGEKGTLEFRAYTGAEGDERYLGIYLPACYEADREKPYQVLYISHGMQAENKGAEMRWLHECAVVNIMDNLGTDFVLVAMNNQDKKWDYDKIWAEMELIMPFIENNYNVSADPMDRAFSGFSMGGMTTSVMYMEHAEHFHWFGIWSAAEHNRLMAMSDEAKRELAKKDVKIQIAYGDWDWCMPFLDSFASQLHSYEIPFDFFTVPGSHDWRTWELIFADSVRKFLFK